MCACWDAHDDMLQIPGESTCCECGSNHELTVCPGSAGPDCSSELCSTCVGMRLCRCCREHVQGQSEALVVNADEVVHSVTIANTTKLGSVVADSGCRRNVAGSSWHGRRMKVLMQEHGLCPQEVECIEKFRFGDERIEQSIVEVATLRRQTAALRVSSRTSGGIGLDIAFQIELEMLFEHLHHMTVPRHYTRTNLWSDEHKKEPPRSALLGAYIVRGSGVSEWTN
eukprot:3480490-Amphidinium_carterae.2